MSAKFQVRLRVALVSAVAMLVAWKWIPGTALDRTAFTAVARGFANGPLFVSGEGGHADPWTLRTFSSHTKADPRQAPVIVSLDDDLHGFFQTSPPAPIDLAVILSNFQRLGANKAATAAVFAWEKPDPIGLAALDKALAGFDSLVMAVPLSRGVVAAQMPAALRRASIPVAEITGDASALPRVNRIPVPGVILGGESTIAGFSVLESEPTLKFLPLMARWEDRVVFSFPLLTVLQRLDLPLDGVEVRLGEFLKLGPSGPIVPINGAGRLAMPLKPVSSYAEISAEALIDGGEDLFPKQAPDPVILRDDQSAVEPTTRAFSRSVSAAIAAIASSGGLTQATGFARLSEGWEILLLAGLVLAMAALSGTSRFVIVLGTVGLVGALAAAQWSVFGIASIWLPGLPALAIIVSALAAGWVPVKSPPLHEIPLPPPSLAEPEPEPVIHEVKSQSTPPRKTAAKKTAARKVAAKKTATQKPPAPKTPRTRKKNNGEPPKS